ncbi:SOS response-associated peptidase [Armatimonas rosea]|uniref:Abasic site processing protein n=1 Tax=Armatimonas rosea TaxID=685828 RepID=A0A7W9SP57_ARMRO|nr:SOS response-associated peptidase [Armatimonas rosea]MBB6050211.1 putative SOS response-associated peptidase YedK [Armatimonas rosea]
MCGRFTMHHGPDELMARFDIQGSLFEPTARYNIAPTQPVAAVTAHGPRAERLLEPLHWGLVPFWAKDTAIASKLINARSETVQEKPSFKHALSRRRCLIPADGFYEWDRKTKQPTHFRVRGGELFAFAGLYEEWHAPDGSPLRTCTVLTTEANALVAPIHERMPVILQNPDDEAMWLEVGRYKPLDLPPLFSPFPADQMDAIFVSKRVGSPANDDAELLVPVG